MLDLVPYMLALPVMSSLSHSLRAMCLLAMVRHYTWPTWLLHGLPALPALARQGPLTLPSSPIRQEHQSHRSDCEYRKTTVATTTVFGMLVSGNPTIDPRVHPKQLSTKAKMKAS
ncbi:hypothetical protein PC118_g15511 [Phytophthora cactorum]|uniref:Uncharacterized protein n=1 Tax=Phytophthora cactorum TaxID=29920 RepID=A0A8T1FCT9_9STRA|nr:hypothetical protein PC118_g15511 [Phytophthora cactorum]